MNLWLPFVIFVVVACTMLLVQIYSIGCKMSEPEKMIKPITGGLNDYQQQVIAHYKPWLDSIGLEYHTSFQFSVIQTIVFKQGNMPRFLAMMFHKKLTFCAESQMENFTQLETSNSGSSGLFPRPLAYAQSFPDMPVEQLWQRHLEGEAWLSKKFGYQWPPLTRPYMDYLAPALRIRMQHNRAQFLWPVRVLYRFFVTRNTIRGRTMAQQFP